MTMITPSYLGETIEYSSLHACRSTLEDPTRKQPRNTRDGWVPWAPKKIRKIRCMEPRIARVGGELNGRPHFAVTLFVLLQVHVEASRL